MKKPQTVLNELREKLHYYQCQYRVELRFLRASRRKIHEIGAEMREAQKMIKPKKAKK